jgi:enoyl-CoA hydratase/carnithine racemase
MARVQFKNITYEWRDRTAVITISRPERLNAIDDDTSVELREAFTAFRDDREQWVAVLTGAGEKEFSTGADLRALAETMKEGGNIRLSVPFGGITSDFRCWKPVIAAINGYCLAGGLELALSCDVRIAAEHAEFGLPEVTRAITPGAGGTQRLPRVVPQAAAMHLLLTGGRFDASWAVRFGLVTEAMAGGALLERALGVASEICRKRAAGRTRGEGGSAAWPGRNAGPGLGPGNGLGPAGDPQRRRPGRAARLRREARACVQRPLGEPHEGRSLSRTR